MNTPISQMPASMVEADISSFIEDMRDVDRERASRGAVKRYILSRGVTLPDALPPLASGSAQ